MYATTTSINVSTWSTRDTSDEKCDWKLIYILLVTKSISLRRSYTYFNFHSTQSTRFFFHVDIFKREMGSDGKRDVYEKEKYTIFSVMFGRIFLKCLLSMWTHKSVSEIFVFKTTYINRLWQWTHSVLAYMCTDRCTACIRQFYFAKITYLRQWQTYTHACENIYIA